MQIIPSLAQALVWISSAEFRQSMLPTGVDIVEAALFLACSLFLILRARQVAEWIVLLQRYPQTDAEDF